MKYEFVKIHNGYEQKIPVFRNRKELSLSFIEQAIVIGMNKIESKQVKKRMREMTSIKTEENKNYAIIEVYDNQGKCCSLKMTPTIIGCLVEEINDHDM